VQRDDDLARHYASADVFLFPSLTDTFGNVTLEALASGLALAAFDTAAAALHAVDGVSACLARGSDPAAFIAAAQRALEAAAPGGALRRAAREAALRADWEQPLRSFEQALRAVVAERSREPARDPALA
jgi:glycosyltransferase involved in cell wall biosynthesis